MSSMNDYLAFGVPLILIVTGLLVHFVGDLIIEGINYYIFTPLENAGIPVQMVHINVPIDPIAEAFIISGIVSAIIIFLVEFIRNMWSGSSIP